MTLSVDVTAVMQEQGSKIIMAMFHRLKQWGPIFVVILLLIKRLLASWFGFDRK